VPQVDDLIRFDKLLGSWDGTRRIMFCDEALAAAAPSSVIGDDGPWAIFIGPEGGFSERERARLRAMDAAVSVSLGPRILRADTAAVAAMTLWQHTLGDWR
jgi:16S rRNA (uracil1498-N3)-methyltransferase